MLKKTLTRGTFAAIPTWGELIKKRAVYRDGSGEHVRLYAGVSVYNDSSVVGHNGVILADLPGTLKQMRLDNGRTITIGSEVLIPLKWDDERLSMVRA